MSLDKSALRTVISARWKSYSDVVIEDVTGLGYDFNTNSELESILDNIVDHPYKIIGLKENCIRKAENFLPQNALKPLFNRIK